MNAKTSDLSGPDADFPDIPKPFLDSLEDSTAILNEDGRIVAVNAAWHQFVNNNDLSESCEFIGRNYFRVIEQAEHAMTDRISNKLRELLNHQNERIQFEYPGNTTDQKRWFKMRASCFNLNDQTYLTVTHTDITERKLREIELEQTRQRFNQLAENLEHVFWIIPEDYSEYEYLSPYFEELWGRKRDEFENLPEDFLKTIHPEDRDRIKTNFEQQTRGNYEVEYRILRPDGEIRWIRDRAFPIRDETGDVVKVAGISEDITEQKETKRALQKSEERFRNMAEYINDAFYLITPEADETLYVNPATEEIYGVPREELLNDPEAWMRNIHPEDLREIQARMDEQDLLDEPLTNEFRILNDGEIRWVRVKLHPIFNQDGEVENLAGITTDITERKKAKNQLKEQYELLDAINDRMPGVAYQFTVDPDGNYSFSYLSEGLYELLGVSAEKALDDFQNALRHVPEDDLDDLLESIRQSVNQRSDWVYETRINHPDGETKWIRGSARPDIREDDSVAYSGVIMDITEQKNLENKLTNQNKRRELAQQIASLGHWSISFPDREVHWSDEVYRILGFDPEGDESARYEDIPDYYHEDDRDRVIQCLENAIDDGETVKFEARIVRPDGEIRHVECYGKPRYTETEDLDDIFGVFQDITERKEREKQLQQSEQRFRQIAENIDEVFWITTPEKDEMTYVSPAYEEIWGRTKESLYQNPQSFMEAIHPEDRKEIQQAQSHQKQGEYDVEYRIKQPDGEIRWIRDRAFPIEDETGEVYRIVGIAEDITETKRLQRERKKFVDLVEHSPNFIGRANLDGELTYINRAGKALIGIENKEEILGEPLESLHPETDHPKLQETFETVTEQGTWRGFRQFLNLETGETTETIFNSFMINDPETGEPMEHAGIATDISEQIETERQLKEMIDEKEILLQEIHHRVKNNLQVILGLLGLQAREVENPDAKDALENSKQRIHTMALIHQNLYQTSQLSSLNFEDYVEDLVEQIRGLQDDGSIHIETDIESGDLSPDTAITLGLIINELVTNTIKHGFNNLDNGRIMLKFGFNKNRSHQLIIEDNGKGVDPEKLEEANSLGMRLVRNLTENQLHGELTFTRKNGLRVEVTFPPPKKDPINADGGSQAR